MFTEERRQEILNQLGKNGRVFAKDLADQFQMSIDSIRRDLTMMEGQGLLKRTHGGAIPVPNVRKNPELPAKRYGEGSVYQNAIAKVAATFIKDKETVFIGGASIHYVMLKYLPKEISYTVVTNSVEIAYFLRELDNIETYLIGGFVKRSGNITDALANEFVNQFSFDVCFATAGGITTKGLSTASPEVSVFHRSVFDNSKEVIALLEHHKFDVEMFSTMYSINGIDIIITDEETTEDKINSLKAKGIDVIISKLID